jgi:hypothetical protein
MAWSRLADRSIRWGLVIGAVALLAIYVASPMTDTGDSHLVFADAHSLLYQRNLNLDEFASSPKVAHHYSFVRTGHGDFDYFPWMASLIAVPAVAGLDIAHVLGVGVGSDAMIRRNAPGLVELQHELASVVAAVTAMLLAAVGLSLVQLGGGASSADGELDEIDRPRLLLAVGFVLTIGLATPLWSTTSRGLWQHVPAGLALAIALWCLSRTERSTGRWWLPASGAFSVAMVWSRPATFVIAGAVGVAVVVLRRRWTVPFVGGAVGAGVVLLVADRVLLGRFEPLYVGGTSLSLGRTTAEALAANVVSPNRGVVWFSSVIVVGVVVGLLQRWPGRSIAMAAAGTFVVYLCLVSAYGTKWWAGHSIGPRFLTEGILICSPVALAALVIASRRLRAGASAAPSLASGHGVLTIVVVLTLGFSLWANGTGAVFKAAHCWNDTPNDIDQHPGRVWQLTDASFLRPITAIRGYGLSNALDDC